MVRAVPEPEKIMNRATEKPAAGKRALPMIGSIIIKETALEPTGTSRLAADRDFI